MLSARVDAPSVQVLLLKLMPKRKLKASRREEEILPFCDQRSDNGELEQRVQYSSGLRHLTSDFRHGVKGCWASDSP